MRVLVTGGAGYIGSHTLVDLLKNDHDIRAVDNFCNSSEESLRRVQRLANRPLAWDRCDIRAAADLAQIVEDFRPDGVIHFAGLKAVGESAEIPLDYYDVNVSGTISLLRALNKVGCKRMIFSSSATVYGEPKYLPYDEQHPVNPLSAYGRTKMICEHLVRDWQAATPGSYAAILRYFNPVGAHASGDIGEDPQDTPNNLMPFIAQVASGQRAQLSVFGDDYETPDGTCIRDYIHVSDLARAHVAALDHGAHNTGAHVVNIGTGRGHSVLEVVQAYERACGHDIPYRIAPRRAGDIAHMQADCSYAQTLLGWKAQHDIDDMCASSWRWQSRNPQGYS